MFSTKAVVGMAQAVLIKLPVKKGTQIYLA